MAQCSVARAASGLQVSFGLVQRPAGKRDLSRRMAKILALANLPDDTKGKRFKLLAPGEKIPRGYTLQSQGAYRTLLGLYRAQALERVSDHEVLFMYEQMVDAPDAVLTPYFIKKHREALDSKTITLLYDDWDSLTQIPLPRSATIKINSQATLDSALASFDGPSWLVPETTSEDGPDIGIKLFEDLEDGGTYICQRFSAGRIVQNIENRDLNRIKGSEAAVGEAVQRMLAAHGEIVTDRLELRLIERKRGNQTISLFENDGVYETENAVYLLQLRSRLVIPSLSVLKDQVADLQREDVPEYSFFRGRNVRLVIAADHIERSEVAWVEDWARRFNVTVLLRTGSDWGVGSSHLNSVALVQEPR